VPPASEGKNEKTEKVQRSHATGKEGRFAELIWTDPSHQVGKGKKKKGKIEHLAWRVVVTADDGKRPFLFFAYREKKKEGGYTPNLGFGGKDASSNWVSNGRERRGKITPINIV